MSLICIRQTPETDGSGNTTREKEGRNPPAITLDEIAEDLLSFFKGLESFNKPEEKIKKIYDIKTGNEHSCWPEDDIKRAWGQVQRMDIKSNKRKHWAVVIILQMLKRSFICGKCKLQAAQENCHAVTDEQVSETTQSMNKCSEERSSQSNADLETVGAAVADEQDSEADMKTSQFKHTEESASESQPSSTDLASSPTELREKITNPNNNETNNAELVNENEDTLVNICEQQKYDNYENVRMNDGLQSTVHQSNADLETVGAAGGDKQDSGAYNNPSDSQYRPDIALGNMPNADETIYIRIPLSVMYRNEQTHRRQMHLPVISGYKLIDGLPSDADIRKRKSYAMSFNNDTGNAEWVYEILNRETSVKNCKNPIKAFGNPYHKGHLAAAANHKWCREALNDANLQSNITPQHMNLNIRTWKTLEEKCRRLTGENGIRNVHVYSGPLYINDEFGQSYYGILKWKKVPTHFFKVIIVENDDGTVRRPECYGMPNDNLSSNPRDYIVDIEDIERVSGLTFIERRPIVRESDEIMSVTLQGEGVNSTLQNVNISVRISS